ncbi:hypothetical protein PHMEG_00041269 [Phytophthora megakarya]|uniref:Retrotransposon gag domain-containing protein n=1 Tax=Phytophthora megakarya TaxID=4795 RepID=A0A225UBR9_9STRA|nr:hypothetical protein PHMEG_00041269 [Phytophthora megakarya]
MGESVDLCFEQLAQYFEAKNIDWKNDDQSSRFLAITTANFKGNAAAWYKLNKRDINDMQAFIAKLTDESVPPDLQERLRDQLYALKKKNCPNLEESLSVSQAMKIALEYDRSHHIKGKNYRPPVLSHGRSCSSSNGNQHQ